MAPSDPRQTKFVLDEIPDPARLVQHRRGPARPAAPAAPPGDRPADRPRRPGPALPDGAHRPGGVGRARDRDPRAGPRCLPPLPAQPALSSPSTRARARYPGPHLLQVRGRQPGRQPQAEHGHPAGVLQPAGGRQAPGHRDRRRAVGERPGVRRRPLRARGQGLHGPRELRPEAVPPDPHGDLRRGGRRQSLADHELRPDGPRRDPGQPRIAGHRDQRGRRGRGVAGRHEVLAGVRAQPRAPAPDGHRAGSDRADGHGRRVTRHHHRLHGRRVELRRPDVPVPRPQLP